MPDFSRQANPQFVAFKQAAERALADNPGLIRLDCLNPIKAIPHEFDFSFVLEIDIKSAWQQFLNVQFETCVFSLGVRDSLYDIFTLLKARSLTVDLPSDVFPVYQMIADSVGLEYRS